MTPVLRPAVQTDVPVLLEIERDSFPQPHWRATDFLKYSCTVADVEGRIAGFLVSRETSPPGDRNDPAEREILNLAVTPAFRRLGIAACLLRSELANPAIHFLEVRESNVAARTLYRKFGFRVVGRRKQYYSRPIETAIVMQRK